MKLLRVQCQEETAEREILRLSPLVREENLKSARRRREIVILAHAVPMYISIQYDAMLKIQRYARGTHISTHPSCMETSYSGRVVGDVLRPPLERGH